MRLIATAVMLVSSAHFVTGCGGRANGGAKSPPDFSVDLTGATVLEVIALDPEPPGPPEGGGVVPPVEPGPQFQGYPYIGRSRSVSVADSAALVASLRKMLARRSDVSWACQLPRHAVRLNTTKGELDVLVDFECGALQILDAQGNQLADVSVDGGDPDQWYAVFDHCGVENQNYPYKP
jgi:hypothetical protein